MYISNNKEQVKKEHLNKTTLRRTKKGQNKNGEKGWYYYGTAELRNYGQFYNETNLLRYCETNSTAEK